MVLLLLKPMRCDENSLDKKLSYRINSRECTNILTSWFGNKPVLILKANHTKLKKVNFGKRFGELYKFCSILYCYFYWSANRYFDRKIWFDLTFALNKSGKKNNLHYWSGFSRFRFKQLILRNKNLPNSCARSKRHKISYWD